MFCHLAEWIHSQRYDSNLWLGKEPTEETSWSRLLKVAWAWPLFWMICLNKLEAQNATRWHKYDRYERVWCGSTSSVAHLKKQNFNCDAGLSSKVWCRSIIPTTKTPKRAVLWFIVIQKIQWFMDTLNRATIASWSRWFTDSSVHWFTGCLIHWVSASLIHWFIDWLIHWFVWFIDLLVRWFVRSVVHGIFHVIPSASQQPFAPLLMHLMTSTLHCFCIAKTLLYAMISYGHVLFLKFPPRRGTATTWYQHVNNTCSAGWHVNAQVIHRNSPLFLCNSAIVAVPCLTGQTAVLLRQAPHFGGS